MDCSRWRQGPQEPAQQVAGPAPRLKAGMGPMLHGNYGPRVHGSWGPELVGGSESISCSHNFVQRGRDRPQDTARSLDPSHLIPFSYEKCILLPPPLVTWLSPAMPGVVRGPRSPGIETFSVSGRGGNCPHCLASYPRDPGKTSSPHLPQRPCTLRAQPFLHIYTN